MFNRSGKKDRQQNKVLDNRGFTLVEMITTFALLGIFLVAVTRMISYTVTLYHETQGAALGMQVSDMIATRLQGVIEDSTLIITDYFYLQESEEDREILESNGFDKGFLPGGSDHIMLKDGNEEEETPVQSETSRFLSLLEKKDEQIDRLLDQHDRLVALLEKETERTQLIISRAG